MSSQIKFLFFTKTMSKCFMKYPKVEFRKLSFFSIYRKKFKNLNRVKDFVIDSSKN